MNPSLGRNFEAMDPLEWLARLADHIPDPGKHRTHFYAHYANRVRGEWPSEELRRQKDEEERPKKRRCSPSWTRLIFEGVLGFGLSVNERPGWSESTSGRPRKAFAEENARSFRRIRSSANAAVARSKVVAYITDTVAIRRILDHLGLSPPEKPPPDVREVVRVPVDDDGREIGANPA